VVDDGARSLSPHTDGTPSLRSSRVAILAIALGLRLFAALTQPIDYNAYWHVFIARNLSREYGSLAHPPLFLLLLKASGAVSHSRLALQAIAILSGLGVVALAQFLLARLRASTTVANLGALTIATAPSAILLSCGVQSYMLAAVFILWSFRHYLDLVRPEPSTGWRGRAAFATLASLGLLTEYYTGLYLVACVAAPALFAVVRPAYRIALARSLRRRLLADVATLLAPVLVGALLYAVIAKPWIHALNSMPQFYFQPGRETAVAFLTRTLASLFQIFSPVALRSPGAAAVLVFGFAVVVFLAVARDRSVEAAAADRAMPAAIFLALLVIGMGMGLRGLYPFGGLMKHQFLLLLFAILAGFVAFDRLVQSVSRPFARGALLGACALAIAGNFVGHLQDLRPAGEDPFLAQARVFEREFPEARTIQVDQLNLIGLFIPYHDWKWRFVGREPANPTVERYELERGGRRLTLIAHRNWWNFDFHDPAVYTALRSAIRRGDPDEFAVFCVHTNLYKPPERRLPDLDSKEVTARITALGPPAGLELRKISFQGNDVYAGFRAMPGSP
jgi:hypothetical protein